MSSATYDKQAARQPAKPWWIPTTTLLWVALITVLVWIYADLEFTRNEELTVTVRLHTGESPDLVLLSESEQRVVFELRGSRRELDRFVGQHDGTVIGYDVSQELGVGLNQRLRADEILHAALELEKHGLSVNAASPDVLTDIDLDRRVLRENVPVQFVYAGAELEADPEIALNVWAVQSHWDRIDKALAASGGKLELRTVTKDLKGVERDKAVDVTAGVIPSIAGVPVQPAQTTVTVKIKIRGLTERKSIRVAVRVIMPYTWLQDDTWHSHQLLRKSEEEWFREIEITGAREDLDKLQAQQVDAYIALTDSDKRAVDSWLERQVHFRFPPELNVRLVGEHKVQFKLEPRKAGAPPTAP